jgi:hypothetical protein
VFGDLPVAGGDAATAVKGTNQERSRETQPVLDAGVVGGTIAGLVTPWRNHFASS